MNTKQKSDLDHAIAQLRHLYGQLFARTIIDQQSVAKHLLGPVIEQLERMKDERRN